MAKEIAYLDVNRRGHTINIRVDFDDQEPVEASYTLELSRIRGAARREFYSGELKNVRTEMKSLLREAGYTVKCCWTK